MTIEPRTIEPIAAIDLAQRLREETPAIIAALTGRPPPRRVKWRFETREDTIIEWNGAEAGPSTLASWTWKTRSAEVVVRLDTIRWSPFEVYRMEVTGLWKAADLQAALFARGEGEAPIVEVRAEEAVWRRLAGQL